MFLISHILSGGFENVITSLFNIYYLINPIFDIMDEININLWANQIFEKLNIRQKSNKLQFDVSKEKNRKTCLSASKILKVVPHLEFEKITVPVIRLEK